MTLTIWIMISLVAFIAVVDTYLFATQGNSDKTFSRVLYVLAQRYPIIPFIFGVVMGHLWWLNV